MKSTENNILYHISKQIVHRRNLIFFLFSLLCAFCLVSISWGEVEDDLTAFLDENSITRQGLEVMEAEFVTFSTAQIMVNHIDIITAFELQDVLAEIEGVQMVTFDETSSYYKNASALFSVMFEGEDQDEISLQAIQEIRELTSTYDTSINTSVGANAAADLGAEMAIITVIAVVVVTGVLILTSKSYAEIPVLFITFGVAALLNMGTNFIFGSISFVSDSVGVILQLALAIDYAIILCHRYAEEREHYEAEEACTVALSKAIIEISSSSLTTICGLFALSFMSYALGADLSKVLIKSILLSLLSVFLVMPGLLVVCSGLIDRTQHRNFVPSIAVVGQFSLKLSRVFPPVFLVLSITCAYWSNQTNYLFSEGNIRAINVSPAQEQQDRITATFGSTNALVLIVPSGSYETEGALIAHLLSYEQVTDVMGLANTEAMDGYMLTDDLNPREFSQLLGVDYELAQGLYAAYALENESYSSLVNQPESQTIPLVDTILFVDDMSTSGYFTLEGDAAEQLTDQVDVIRNAILMLESEQYSRLLVTIDLPDESDETFEFLDVIYQLASEYYDEVYMAGNSTSNADLSATFMKDNLMISILSALFVVGVLLFTFTSVAVPVILIFIIQSAIFINFSIPYLKDEGLFFIGYIIVSAIQMGANVDYAIVITNRYLKIRGTTDERTAIVQALDESFATVLTSGTILASAGMALQFFTTDGTIATLGQCVARGTIISMILVLFVLPQVLYLGSGFIDRTSFQIRAQNQKQTEETPQQIVAHGRVRGYVSGYIDARVYGSIVGTLTTEEQPEEAEK